MSRRKQRDLLQRVLAEADVDELRLLGDLSTPKQALISGLALTKANKIADELLAEVSPQAWAKVKVGRTSLAAVLRRPRPAQSATEALQASEGAEEDPCDLLELGGAENAPENAGHQRTKL